MGIIESFIHEIFAPRWAGKDISRPDEWWRELWLSKRNHLQSSFGLYALAAIDIAIWDITAKIENKPLHQFLNVHADSVAPYGNGGWLSDTKQESIADSEWYLNRGCNRFKIRIGSDNDLERIKGLREAFGGDLILSAANLTLSGHLFHELSVSLVGLCEKHYVEHIDFFPSDFFINDFSIKNGKISLPKDPGHGVTISEQAIKKYSFS